MPVYQLRDQDKKFLREEFGELYTGSDPAVNAKNALEDLPENADLYVVGDFCAENMFEAGTRPEVVVYDGRVEEKPYRGLEKLRGFLEGFDTVEAENPAGRISEEAYRTVGEAINSGKTAVKVDGEEDLLGLAVVDCAESGSYLAYGDPGISEDEGIRLVEVGRFKEKVGRMLDK